jgi:hypothetical protein
MALSRGIPAALLTEYAKPEGFYPIAFIDLDWPSGRVRAHTNSGEITWGGNAYTGIANIATLSLPGDGAGLTNAEGTITIVGTLSDLFDANEEKVKNRAAKVYAGATTSPGGTTLVSDPFLIFDGHMDGTMIPKAEGQHSLILTLGSGPGARVKATVRHSEEDQSTKFPASGPGIAADTAGRHTALAKPNAAKLKWPE